MKKIIRLTESDLARIVRRVVNERQYLTEGLLQALTLTATIPSDYATNQNIHFTLGPLGNNAAKEYKGLLVQLTINGVTTNQMSKQSLQGQYISGEISGTASNIYEIKNALLSRPADYLGGQSDLGRNNATLVVIPDPKNPTKQNEKALIATYKVTRSNSKN